MKHRIYSVILLIILIFNIFRFEIPYIQYALFKDYIAENLCEKKDEPESCCEGKCFREKQIKQINETRETETTNDKSTNKIPQIKETKEFIHHIILIPDAESRKYNYPTYPKVIFKSISLLAFFVPPEF